MPEGRWAALRPSPSASMLSSASARSQRPAQCAMAAVAVLRTTLLRSSSRSGQLEAGEEKL